MATALEYPLEMCSGRRDATTSEQKQIHCIVKVLHQIIIVVSNRSIQVSETKPQRVYAILVGDFTTVQHQHCEVESILRVK